MEGTLAVLMKLGVADHRCRRSWRFDPGVSVTAVAAGDGVSGSRSLAGTTKQMVCRTSQTRRHIWGVPDRCIGGCTRRPPRRGILEEGQRARGRGAVGDV